MAAVIRILGVAGMAEITLFNDLWIAGFTDTRSGFGHIRFADTEDKAMRFASKGEAFTFWQTQSKTVPTRPDGKPNRPMTAFTVEVYELQPGEPQ